MTLLWGLVNLKPEKVLPTDNAGELRWAIEQAVNNNHNLGYKDYTANTLS